ncbi:hypothetical protein GWK47_033973 [Chionoecetes opilio]|uniref:Uncharacterized protein n=1 Tax=Chionoecetes opilio TaxID=41210 RepID=A0A8J4YIS4_CHIOP|nr:hypothetical protein GWK47_033973 [Chionoecetes opilio]
MHEVKDEEKDLKVTWDPSSPTGRLLELRPDPSANIFFSSDSQHNEGYFIIKYATCHIWRAGERVLVFIVGGGGEVATQLAVIRIRRPHLNHPRELRLRFVSVWMVCL